MTGKDKFLFVCGLLLIANGVYSLRQPGAPAQAQPRPFTVRAQVAPLKSAVRQLKSGVWRVTLESQDSALGRLQRGQRVEVSVR